jgi:hypothetical protein
LNINNSTITQQQPTASGGASKGAPIAVAETSLTENKEGKQMKNAQLKEEDEPKESDKLMEEG